jgi:hypothetical protein
MDMKHTAVLIIGIALVLCLCSTASAIKILEETPPADLPANATPEEVEVIEVAVTVTPVKQTDLSIERIAPANALAGEELQIILRLRNKGSETVKATVYEDLRPGFAYPEDRVVYVQHYEGLEVPYYRWDVTLSAGETEDLSYTVRVEHVGVISFTTALMQDEYGNLYESAAGSIVAECDPDGICGPGENYLFCPQDCPSGGSDGVCDGVKDNATDPDCAAGFDPDSGTTPPVTEATTRAAPGALVTIIAACAGLGTAAHQRRQR